MEEREVLSLMISCCVMVFVLFNWSKLKLLSHAKILLACFTALFASWTFSVVEDIIWKEELNFLQHLFSGISGILLAIWLRSVSVSWKTKRVHE